MKQRLRSGLGRLAARLAPAPTEPSEEYRNLLLSLSADHAAQNAASSDRILDTLTSMSERLDQLAGNERGSVEGLFAPAGHFYSPLVGAEELAANWPTVAGADPAVIPGIDLRLDAQAALLGELATMLDDVPFPDGAPDADAAGTALRYHFHNDWYAFQDGLFLHLLLRWLEPSQVVEVGSGYSSAATLDTVDEFLDGKTTCTFIEPYQDRLRALMRPEDEARVTVLEQFVQDVDVNVFASLQAGDLLVIDSSHVCKVGSDLYHLLFRVLPELPAGVVIHFHDIFAGFEYPHSWHVEGRSWNEAYLLRAFLMYNAAFEVLLWPSLLQASRPEQLADFDRWGPHTPGALYLRKVA